MFNIKKMLKVNKVDSSKKNTRAVAIHYVDNSKAGFRCTLVDTMVLGLSKEKNRYKVDSIANGVDPKNIFFNDIDLRSFITKIFNDRKSIKVDSETFTLAKNRNCVSANEFLICACSIDKYAGRDTIDSIDLFVSTYKHLEYGRNANFNIPVSECYGLDDLDELINLVASIFKI